MRTSIKTKILSYLKNTPHWVYGGVIEDFIRQTDGHKASNASRRCRELEDEGKIERRIVSFQGQRVVQYRVKQSEKVMAFLRDYPSKGQEKQPVGTLF